LRAEDFGPEWVEVWEDNWVTVQLFGSLSTQWNVGPGGVVGLRYETFPVVRACFNVDDEDWPDIFHDLRVMEAAAVELLRGRHGE
jgi:hypothetical protein